MTYLDLLKAGNSLGPPQAAERGRTLAHPWKGRWVDSPRGRGQLVWTDGCRAAISVEPNSCWLLDLDTVRLAGG
jgi:hypothetical protein